MIEKNTLIVSFTSYPARIGTVHSVIESLLNQGVERSLYHIVLVLCSKEFPKREIDLTSGIRKLITSGEIEIIWHEKNIKSHKKLIPTLKKYPDNPILIMDDDSIKPKGWLKMFIDDHKKYPNDIIGGNFSWFFSDNLELRRFKSYCRKCGTTMNGKTGIVLNFAKPANGDGGTLYPAGTFTDKRFFDEDLMMELSPTSDESWQFCFNIIEDRTFRQSSLIYDSSERFIEGSQNMPTALHKVNNYTEINKKLFEAFPEFKEKLIERQNRVVVSMTTYKERLKSGSTDQAVKSIVEQSVLPDKILLYIDSWDEEYLTDYLKELSETGAIEIRKTDEKIKPHKKYFYAMKEFRNYAVVTVDDDKVYPKDMLKELMFSYLRFPDCVIARRVHLMTPNGKGGVSSYSTWRKEYTGRIHYPSMNLFPTGVGGILYPPDILGISDKNLEEIEKYVNVDDIYLKLIEQRKGISVVNCKVEKMFERSIDDKVTQGNALQNKNIGSNENDLYIGELTCDRLEYFGAWIPSSRKTASFVGSKNSFEKEGRRASSAAVKRW